MSLTKNGRMIGHLAMKSENSGRMLYPIGCSRYFGSLLALSIGLVCSGFGRICVSDEAPHYETILGMRLIQQPVIKFALKNGYCGELTFAN